MLYIRDLGQHYDLLRMAFGIEDNCADSALNAMDPRTIVPSVTAVDHLATSKVYTLEFGV